MNKNIKSFRRQLKNAFIVVVVIPVLSLSGFLLYSYFQYIENQIVSESINLVKQNFVDIENRIDICDDSLRYLAANYDLKDFLLINREDYLDLSRASKNIRELLYNVLIVNRYYKSLTIYTDKEFFVLTDFVKISDDVKSEEWYENIVESEGSYWWREGNKVFLGRKIMSAYPSTPIGVIKIEIKNNIFSDSFGIFQDVPINIDIKDSGGVFYEYTDSEWNGKPRLKREHSLKKCEWNIIYKIDENYYEDYVFISLGTPILFIIIVLVLSWILIHYFPKKLTKDLSFLVGQIEEVQRGNLDISIKLSETTEINILATSIQNLLNRIKKLIRQVYSKEIERQKLELSLLQSKMNPHFLYNNLSAINWIALEHGQEKIYVIATELANFYRTALNSGHDIDKLSIELENIKAYIKLQLISHENSFKVKYQVDKNLLEKEVPIFILQPLVENAIEHGIDQLWNEEGRIEIIIEQDGEWLQIKVYDNGTALYDKIGVSELSEENFGYGTSNVNKRIRLLYGNESGLKIQADELGTTAIIRFHIDSLIKLI